MEHDGELRLRFFQASELDQGAAERDACREVVGVICEAGAADADGFVVGAGAAALFCELRKSHRRRVRLDPASQFQKSWVVVRHTASLRRNREGGYLRRRLAVAVGDLDRSDIAAGRDTCGSAPGCSTSSIGAVAVVEPVVDDDRTRAGVLALASSATRWPGFGARRRDGELPPSRPKPARQPISVCVACAVACASSVTVRTTE